MCRSANGFADGLVKQGASRVTTLYASIILFFFFLTSLGDGYNYKALIPSSFAFSSWCIVLHSFLLNLIIPLPLKKILAIILLKVVKIGERKVNIKK